MITTSVFKHPSSCPEPVGKPYEPPEREGIRGSGGGALDGDALALGVLEDVADLPDRDRPDIARVLPAGAWSPRRKVLFRSAC